MKRRIISLLLIFALAFSLASCSGTEAAPEGMKAASDAARVGYKLYVPEEWTVSNLEGITAAYVSTLDSSSVSLVEAELPEATVSEYFEESLKDFPAEPHDVKSETALFGNADEAVKYTYNYEYNEHSFGFMQVFIRFGERFFIFTYAALLEDKTDEKTYYAYHLEDVQAIMDNAFFTTGETDTDKPVYESEGGYMLVSDKALSGFSLYVPDSYSVTVSSGIVAADSGRGASLTVMKMTVGKISFSDYWKLRRTELSEVFGEITEISKDVPVTIGNVTNAFAYEYTYEFSGVEYRVYQVFLATGSGYAFTLTSTADSYASHAEELEKIMEKIVFE